MSTLEDLIKNNSNLINSICFKYRDYHDKEDLYQVGVVGLINAYNNYDPSYEVKFSTYAYPYIIGEITKYIRENKNIKISKDIVRLGKKINEYIEKHYKVRGYKPSIDAISNMLGISPDKVSYAIDICKYETKSLSDVINEGDKDLTLYDVTPNKQNITNDQLIDLNNAFKYLSGDEKKLLIDRYFRDLTQSEIAQKTGTNQVQISRLEKKALCKLKQRLV